MNLPCTSKLLFSASVLALISASSALAQTSPVATARPSQANQAAGATAQAGGESSQFLGEVIVTATKQASTINKVPLSVTATTQKDIDQQGITNISDLARSVPALNVTSALTQSTGTFAIRGISAASGAATVGVYLDDSPLTKRQISGAGGSSNGNGSPLPALFDLDRIEVLRGPQGTLYGGSSEGGTIRFITPTPSLTTYSTYIRTQLSGTDGGDPSYDAGVAVGGPIVQDKLGFRVSIYDRHTGGYIDHINQENPSQISSSNSNAGSTQGVRLALLWKPTERATVELSGYQSRDKVDDTSTYNLPTGAIIEPEICTSYTGIPSTTGVPRLTNCAAPTTPITHIYPGTTFGPYNLQPYQVAATPTLQPELSRFRMLDLTLG